jgi:hypothetical protein
MSFELSHYQTPKPQIARAQEFLFPGEARMYPVVSLCV